MARKAVTEFKMYQIITDEEIEKIIENAKNEIKFPKEYEDIVVQWHKDYHKLLETVKRYKANDESPHYYLSRARTISEKIEKNDLINDMISYYETCERANTSRWQAAMDRLEYFEKECKRLKEELEKSYGNDITKIS